MANTLDEQKVSIAEVYLTGRADQWIRSNEIDTGPLSWQHFCIMIKKRFATETWYDITKAFIGLNQEGTIEAYIDKFENMMTQVKRNNSALKEGYFLDYFVSGLKGYIKTPLKSLEPKTLVEAYSHARNYENSQSYKKAISWNQSTNSTGQYQGSTQNKWNNAGTKQESSDKTTAGSGNKWNRGKCFKCNEPWVPGHSKACKFQK